MSLNTASIFHRLGGNVMPTGEELEQRVNDSLDDMQKEYANARAVIHKLDVERLDEIFAKAVKPD